MTTIANAEVKLDQWGMGAWIALMVLGFFLWWPLGLAILAPDPACAAGVGCGAGDVRRPGGRAW